MYFATLAIFAIVPGVYLKEAEHNKTYYLPPKT